MKIVLLLTLLHLGAAFELDAAPELVSFRRMLVDAQGPEPTDRLLMQASTNVLATTYTPELFSADLKKVFTEQQLGYQPMKEGPFQATMRLNDKEIIPIFECVLKDRTQQKTDAPALSRKYVVCTNRPPSKGTNPPQASSIDPKTKKHAFARFAGSHAVYARAVSARDNLAQIAFIRDSVAKLKDIAMRVLWPKKTDDLLKVVKEVLADPAYNDIDLREKFHLTNSNGFDLYEKSSNLKIFQVIAYTINERYLGLEFSTYDQTRLVLVSRMDLDSAKAQIQLVLKGRPTGEQLNRLKIDDMLGKIQEVVKAQCPNDPQKVEGGVTLIGKGGEPSTFLEVKAKRTTTGLIDPKNICAFAESSFLITYFHYNHFQIFEMLFDSKQLTFEVTLLTDKDHFDAKFKEAMTLIQGNEDLVKQMRADATMEVFVSLEGIKRSLETAFGGEPGKGDVSEDPNPKYNSGNPIAPGKMVLVSTFHVGSVEVDAKVNRTPEEFLIQLFKKQGTRVTPVYGEVTLPLANGYNYEPVLVKNLKDFLARADEAIKTAPAVKTTEGNEPAEKEIPQENVDNPDGGYEVP